MTYTEQFDLIIAASVLLWWSTMLYDVWQLSFATHTHQAFKLACTSLISDGMDKVFMYAVMPLMIGFVFYYQAPAAGGTLLVVWLTIFWIRYKAKQVIQQRTAL